MNTDVLKISKIHTNQLVNVLINSSIKQLQRLTCYPHLRVFLKTPQCHLARLFLSKYPKIDNDFVNLPQHWMSNQRLPSPGYMLLNKSTRQLENSVSYGTKLQRGKAVQKSTSMLRVRSVIGLFATLKLFSLKYPTTVSKLLLMGRQHRSYFQICYYIYQPEICII